MKRTRVESLDSHSSALPYHGGGRVACLEQKSAEFQGPLSIFPSPSHSQGPERRTAVSCIVLNPWWMGGAGGRKGQRRGWPDVTHLESPHLPRADEQSCPLLPIHGGLWSSLILCRPGCFWVFLVTRFHWNEMACAFFPSSSSLSPSLPSSSPIHVY